MRTLLVLLTSILSIPAWAGALDEAKSLGAPMESVERAIQLPFLTFHNLPATAVSFSSI